MEVSAAAPKPKITIILSYEEAQRLRQILRKYEYGEFDVSPDRQLGRALEDAGVELP